MCHLFADFKNVMSCVYCNIGTALDSQLHKDLNIKTSVFFSFGQVKDRLMLCTQRELLIFEDESQANLMQMHNSSKMKQAILMH